MNILVTLDRNYLPPLRVMLGSLLRNDPGETFEIYAIGDGLLPEDWTALEELCAGRGHIHPLEAAAAFSGPGAVSGPGHSGNQSCPGPV